MNENLKKQILNICATHHLLFEDVERAINRIKEEEEKQTLKEIVSKMKESHVFEKLEVPYYDLAPPKQSWQRRRNEKRFND